MIGDWLGQWLGSWIGYVGGDVVLIPRTFDYVIYVVTGRRIMEPQYFEKRQGNSFWLKLKCRRWSDIDDTWTNFGGTWKLFDGAGVEVYNGSLIRSATEGVMYAKISPAQMLALTLTTYTLACEVINTTQDYKEERQDYLTIFAASSI